MTTVDVDRVAPETPVCGADRLDVPGVVDNFLLMGSVKHVTDEQLLKNMRVTYVLDAENPRKRAAHPELAATADPTVEMGRIELDDDFSYDEFKRNLLHATKLLQAARSDDKTVGVSSTRTDTSCSSDRPVHHARLTSRSYARWSWRLTVA
ncbi:hypothetical protein PF001_g18363 [Phytophthora fragariae]|uniref:Uncharacterized protein n=1 Tax=Phytophthora fragariae TaxID=53985 RepID=A0A6A3E6T6_9STRA|nr:hypothetical protein PF003_g39598 [Phytophthora fragariae]KAE8929579.1 hypothetical protein PF009_g20303 [Phytophthora fragariae]KAE9134094.1 hypothetical protein PF006_g14896 [Phytophthora fragariae]KAE9293207.1 hypothetical protein PF001_g18363 [Phytophthora fragariae]